MANKGDNAPKRSIRQAFAQSIFTWFGIPLDAVSGGAVSQHWEARSLTTGQIMTVQESMKLSAVWACVKLIAGTIAALPLKVYKINGDGSKSWVPNHPIAGIIARYPNKDMTGSQFWESFIYAMLLWGDGFAEVKRIGGRIVALQFLLPQRLNRTFLFDGTEIYKYTDFDGVQRQIDEKNILRSPGVTFDGINGLSVIAYGADVFGSARASGEAAGRVWENGMRPSGTLSVDKFLTKKQRDDIQENILPKFSGSANSAKTLVLEGGMKWDSIQMPPDDAELLASRAFSTDEICRWFAVPPFMVGHAEKTTSWGSGVEQQMLGFRTFCLQQWMTRVEQAIARRMLSLAERDSHCVEFDADGIMRADSAGRAAFYTQMVNNGLYTRNEVRHKEGLPDAPGGDKLTVLSSLTTLDKVGEIPPSTGEPGLPSSPGDPNKLPGEKPSED